MNIRWMVGQDGAKMGQVLRQSMPPNALNVFLRLTVAGPRSQQPRAQPSKLLT